MTFTSAEVGDSGLTPSFSETGPWEISWSFECANDQGTFAVLTPWSTGTVALAQDGASGTGADYYYYPDFSNLIRLEVESSCSWSITVAPTSGSQSTPVTYTSSQSGITGNTEAFTVSSPWTMAWSYSSCTGTPVFTQPPVFALQIDGTTADILQMPYEVGYVNDNAASGSGVAPFSLTGTFNLAVQSNCAWSVTINQTNAPAASSSHGYWLVGSDGGIFSFGSAQFYGSTGSLKLQRPVVGIVPTKDDGGYWLDASDGGVFSYGDTQFYGSIPGLGLHPAGSGLPNSLNAPIVGMVPSNDDNGYFMVASDGGVFAFGDAHFAGSCPGIGGCSGAAVAVMPDASGNGYWLVTQTGNIYTFGDAAYYGAPGNTGSPVTSAVRTPDGKGYWILTANGTVYNYGDAANDGDAAGAFGGLNPASAIFTTSDGGGYWIASANGTVDNYGDAPNDGGMSGTHLNGSIIAATGF